MKTFDVPFEISGCFMLNRRAKESFLIGILDKCNNETTQEITKRLKYHFGSNKGHNIESVAFEDENKHIIIEIENLDDNVNISCYAPNYKSIYDNIIDDLNSLEKTISRHYNNYIEKIVENMLKEKKYANR